MRQKVLESIVNGLRRTGPFRVMIDEHEAVPSARAEREHGIRPDVVFIRDDGWSLGAPAHLESAARALWEGSWVAVVRDWPNGPTEPVGRRTR